MAEAKSVIFVHTPKCGGTTLSRLMYRNYGKITELFLGDMNDQLNRQWIPGVSNAAFGHVPYQDWSDSNRKKFGFSRYYIALTRHPFQYSLSLYWYILENKNHRLHEFARDRSFSQFLNYCRQAGILEMNNPQCALLSGGCADENLDLAKQRIKDNFFAVAPLEKFDDFLALCSKKFGWRDVRYNVENKSGNDGKFDREAQRIMEDLLCKDLEIYYFSQKMFLDKFL